MEGIVRLAAIGVGNRTGKYLRYVLAHPERVQLVAIAEPDPVRREACRKLFALEEGACYESAEQFFENPRGATAVVIGSPDAMHYTQATKAIALGLHVLLEKPVAQNYGQCLHIAEAAKEKGVDVEVCYVLRFMPIYQKIKQLLDEGSIGRVTGVTHHEYVGIDRMLHTYVRGYWNKTSESNPSFISKCCHDVDMLLWTTGAHITSVQSTGSLEWYKRENAPEGSAYRCVECPVEGTCAYSAVDMYRRRKVWTDNFPIPEGSTKEEVIEEELRSGRYGRCAFKCDNDVSDRQVVTLRGDGGVMITVIMNTFTRREGRRTVFSGTAGELVAEGNVVQVTDHLHNTVRTFDFSSESSKNLHMGADLLVMEDFIESVADPSRRPAVTIEDALESHRLCFLAG